LDHSGEEGCANVSGGEGFFNPNSEVESTCLLGLSIGCSSLSNFDIWVQSHLMQGFGVGDENNQDVGGSRRSHGIACP
jgi:hypothetical protein